MRQKGIQFSAKASISEPLPFEKADICAVFANALDNAVESCLKLEQPLRKVHMDAKSGKGILAVNISNSCQSASAAAKPAAAGQLPKTTKKDSKNHGLGLRSIQTIVKKYGGNMEIRQEEEMFHLFLYLPMGT